MERKWVCLLLLLAATKGFSQKSQKSLFGTYADNTLSLTLLPDSTFEMVARDLLFPHTTGEHRNKGRWTAQGDTFTLNPNKVPRQPTVTIVEEALPDEDSIKVEIIFWKENYQEEKKISTTAFPFEMLTVYLNKKKNHYNLRHNPIQFQGCLFAPPVKRVCLLDSANSGKLPPQEVQKIGIFTYGFEKAIEVPVLNPKANFFRITLVQAEDAEQMPRSKKVILKRGKAFYYEQEGYISTSPITDNGLKKKQ